jgi:hypothetical protein
MSSRFSPIHNNDNDSQCYYFRQAFTTFEEKNSTLENLPISDAKFGILNFTAVYCLPTKVEQDFVFVIDNSGSMTDLCSDKRTKMQHIIHTLKKMVIYFRENPDIKANITIFTFDDKFCKVVERVNIKEKIHEILDKIDNIEPDGGTNIELALKKTSDYIYELRCLHPNNQINHIFMTDGEVTIGENNPNNLLRFIDKSVYNIFVGFGINHDANLLNTISTGNKGAYYFVDEIEKAGLVYGEILHSLLYKMIYDVEICITNGFIYNYISNLWTNKLYIGDITGETNKIYHIISNYPDDFRLLIQCKKNKNDNFNTLSFSINKKDNDVETDFDKYIFRQRTLELLYAAKKCQQEQLEYYNYINHIDYIIEDFNMDDDFINNKTKQNDEELKKKYDDIEKNCNIVKKKMFDLLLEMKKYMQDNNMCRDGFITNLCSDIYISHKTFGTKYGNMFICARQTSQGTQRGYTVCRTPDLSYDIQYENIRRISPLKLSRYTNNTCKYDDFEVDNYEVNDSEEDDNDTTLDLNYNVYNFENAPYLTPTATQIMRSVSDNTSNVEKFHFYLSDTSDSSNSLNCTP